MTQIQELKIEDWEKLRGLYLELLSVDPGAFIDEYDNIALRTKDQWIEGLKKKGKVFVAVDGDKFVGMGRINFYDELPGVPVLHKLGVLPLYRGQGLAKSLVKAREDWAKSEGATKVRLYVIADRLKTIEFSKKNGYEVKEVLKNNSQRKDGSLVDVVIMEKDL
jgi:GNAT superfamily N-acetyltransferase